MGQVRGTRPRVNAVRPRDRKGFFSGSGGRSPQLKRSVTRMIAISCSQNATLGRIVVAAADDISHAGDPFCP